MNKLITWISKPYANLVFSLLSGLAYFFIVLKFVIGYTSSGGLMLGFFFCPAIICGMALILTKAIRAWLEQEKYNSVIWLVIAHIVLFLIGIVFFIDTILM